MRESTRMNGLLMLMMASAMVSGSGTRLRLPVRDGGEPLESTPEQIDYQTKGNNDGQLHRFVIGGREVWARNKKDAIKKAKRPCKE